MKAANLIFSYLKSGDFTCPHIYFVIIGLTTSLTTWFYLPQHLFWTILSANFNEKVIAMNAIHSPGWEQVQQAAVTNLRRAHHHLWTNVAAYLGLFLVEYFCAQIGHSQVLRADAFNNLSGIFSTGLLMTGLYIAAKTDDDDMWGAPISPEEQHAIGPRIQQSRFRFETIYTLIAGLVMVVIAAGVVYQAAMVLIQRPTYHLEAGLTVMGAGISSLILFFLWATNHHWARVLSNSALAAAARDSWTDALTSLVTVLTILGIAWLHATWIDGVASLILGLYILGTGVKIFRNSALNLVDYFDPALEKAYRTQIAQMPDVQSVIFLKAYYDGNLIMVSVTIAVNPQMTAATIYDLTRKINILMKQRFNVAATALMVIPANRL
jgi:cation diffusion facilitator family transporter